MSMKGTVTSNVLAWGVERLLTLTDVKFAKGVKHNLIRMESWTKRVTHLGTMVHSVTCPT